MWRSPNLDRYRPPRAEIPRSPRRVRGCPSSRVGGGRGVRRGPRRGPAPRCGFGGATRCTLRRAAVRRGSRALGGPHPASDLLLLGGPDGRCRRGDEGSRGALSGAALGIHLLVGRPLPPSPSGSARSRARPRAGRSARRGDGETRRGLAALGGGHVTRLGAARAGAVHRRRSVPATAVRGPGDPARRHSARRRPVGGRGSARCTWRPRRTRAGDRCSCAHAGGNFECRMTWRTVSRSGAAWRRRCSIR